METKEYFEKIMQDYNQHRNGRSLRKYCKDEGVDYNWLIEYKSTYPNEPGKGAEVQPNAGTGFVALTITERLEERKPEPQKWEVACLQLRSPQGDVLEIRSTNLSAVSELLQKMS